MENKLCGKIIQGVGGLYSVRILNTDSPLFGKYEDCRARGSFRHNNLSPLPGDNVILLPATEPARDLKDKNEGKEQFVIDEILPRKNSLIRPPLANLDYIFVTMSAASPIPVLSTVDKMTAIAEFNGIEPVIVITKAELDRAYAKELEEIYKKCGFTVFTLSAALGEGIEPMEQYIAQRLPTKTAAFAGASGIGKSTLLNRLFPNLSLSTSEISRKIQRGRHTTRKVELFPLSDAADCGYIADTPGFSMLDFERFDFFEKDNLFGAMRELRPLEGMCRYTKCSHTKEEGCAVVEAVSSGDIPASRHQSYCELYDILKKKKKW